MCSCADSVSVKIMGLEKSGPEFLLRHVMRHIFAVFLLHCKQNGRLYEWLWLNLESAVKVNTKGGLAQSITRYVKDDFFLYTCRISSEDGLNNVSCEIISQTIAAICLWSNICLRSIKSHPWHYEHFIHTFPQK